MMADDYLESEGYEMEMGNASDNSTYDYEYSVWDYPEQVLVPAAFAVIFVIGLVGNATLIFIVLRNKPMRTKPNVLIVNLSIGDFLLILISVPFTSVVYTSSEWPFGTAICKLSEFMQTLSLGVSIFTLTALSADRFIAIVFPLTSYSTRTSLTRVIVASVVIWVVSTGLGLMDLVGAQAGNCQHCYENATIQICHVYPPEWGMGYKTFRLMFRFVVYFAVPLIIIVCLYVIIAVVLLRQALSLSPQTDMKVSSSAASSVRRAPKLRRQESVAVEKQNESRKKVAKVVLSFVVIFVICWLPRHVYVMCFHLDNSFRWSTTWHVVKIVSFCLMFIYSAINPLALYLLNAEYRRYFHHYLFGCCYKPWRIRNTGWQRSTVSSFAYRSTTYSVPSTDAVSMTTCSVPAINRGTSRTSVSSETAMTITAASLDDDNNTRL